MSKKKVLGLIGGSTAIGYLLKDKIGSLIAYLIEGLEENVFQKGVSSLSYTSVVPKNEGIKTFNYWMEKLHPIDVKFGSDIVLLLGIPALAAATTLVGYYLIKRK